MDETFKKILQKRCYDLLSHKYGILMILAGGFLLTISVFQFGEAWLEWSQEKYEAVFNSFSDNIAGKSFRDRLSVPLPIDVVYTWVNGTDPELLRQLEKVKISMEKKSNLSREDSCTYTNCLPVGMLLYPPLPSSVTVAELVSQDHTLTNVTELKDVREKPDGPSNFTLLSLPDEADVKRILKLKNPGFEFHGVNHTVKPAFYTSDVSLPHGLVLPDLVMMSGFPNHFSEEDVHTAIIKRLNVTQKTHMKVKLDSGKGLALLDVTQKSHYDSLVKDKNFTIDGKEIRLSPVKLVWDVKFIVTDDVVTANRFEDNEELRYSLRSVEKFAPWVRHIFIVTNGQIPYWLNLDNPRISVITHDEIFLNASHLPTFSSPAIEANIHRIPGLSDKFLYLNDDVMFGRPVWPDDFYTHATGHKLYLTWPVPNCNEGCPSTWIRDGYCDKACNSSECEWDGGDCLGTNGHVQLGAGFHGGSNHLTDYTSYCATGCANNWLADKYCDSACNNLDCAFDNGDCGIANYNKLYDLELQPGKLSYLLPTGEHVGFFNLTELLGETGKITSAKFTQDTAVRAASVANKFKVLTVLLKKGQNATTLTFNLEYQKEGNDTHSLNFTLGVNTTIEKIEKTVELVRAKNMSENNTVKAEDLLDAEAFQPWTGNQWKPMAENVRNVNLDSSVDLGIDADILNHFKEISMSDGLRKKLESLNELHRGGELTDVGLKIRLYEIMREFQEELETLKPRFEEERIKKAAERKEDILKNGSKNVTGNSSLDGNQQLKHLPAGVLLLHNKLDSQNIQGLQKQKSWLKHQRSQVGVQPYEQQQAPKAQQIKIVDNQNFPLPHREGKLTKMDNRSHPLQNQEQLPPQHRERKSKNGLDEARERQVENPMRSELQKKKRETQPELPREKQDKLKAADPNEVFEAEYEGIPGLNLGGIVHQENMDFVQDENVPKKPGRKLLAILYWSNHMASLEEKRVVTFNKMKKDSLGEEMSDEEFLRLVNIDSAGNDAGGFPWEKTQEEENLTEGLEASDQEDRKANEYTVEGWQGRQLLDTYGDSLRHVNRIYNKQFGFTSRKVPAHMPHMVDKNVMSELQDRFPKEWDVTSSHKIRSSTDMQYAFAYYYYLVGVTVEVTVEEVFEQIDTDHSLILSDREIRTLAARMYDLPLYLETLTGLENHFKNCSQHMEDPTVETLDEDEKELYYDKDMPQVTKYLFTQCQGFVELVKEKFKPKPKYKTTIVDDSDIAFKMIQTNVSHVVGQLDDIRKHAKKFICLNDNIDHRKEEAKTVKAILQDFYESLLPNPTQFELPRDYRNRFLHMDQLREWRVYRDRLRFWTHAALAALVILTIISFLGEKIENLSRKWSNKFKRRHRTSSDSDSSPPTSVSVSPSSKSTEESGFTWVEHKAVETV